MSNKPYSEEVLKKDEIVVFGFWMYLMTDLVLFASLFAVFVVLRTDAYAIPEASQLFSLPYALIETLILLTSSFIAGLMLLAANAGKKNLTLAALIATLVLGAAFISMEISEFSKLIISGNGPQKNGFLSSYVTLVGTHGIHISIGLLWGIVMVFSIVSRGLTRGTMRKLALWSLFWHFLDSIWIFIFAIVYLQ